MLVITRATWCNIQEDGTLHSHIEHILINDWMSYITLTGHWCHIIVLNSQAPTEGKADEVKDTYEELEYVPNKYPKHHLKIFLGDDC
jgi:hypothetical protein